MKTLFTTIVTLLVLWFVMIILRRALTRTLTFSYFIEPAMQQVSAYVCPLMGVEKTECGKVYVRVTRFPNTTRQEEELTFSFPNGVIRARLFDSTMPQNGMYTLNMMDGSGAYLEQSGTIEMAVHPHRRDVQIHLIPRLFFSHGL